MEERPSAAIDMAEAMYATGALSPEYTSQGATMVQTTQNMNGENPLPMDDEPFAGSPGAPAGATASGPAAGPAASASGTPFMSAGGFGAEEDDPFADTGDTFAGGDEVDLDLEIELERPEGDIIPEGEHPFMVDSIVSTGRGPSGFPNIRFRTVCVDGPGRLHEVLENLSLSPKARFRVVPLLNGLGAPITGKWKARDLIGKKFWGVVEYEEYDGRPQPRFTAFRPGADIETDYVPRPWREEAEAEAVTVGSAQHAQATLGSEFAE